MSPIGPFKSLELQYMSTDIPALEARMPKSQPLRRVVVCRGVGGPRGGSRVSKYTSEGYVVYCALWES